MKLTVNRFGMNVNKALKYGAKTAGGEGENGGREKTSLYSSNWLNVISSVFVIYFY